MCCCLTICRSSVNFRQLTWHLRPQLSYTRCASDRSSDDMMVSGNVVQLHWRANPRCAGQQHLPGQPDGRRPALPHPQRQPAGAQHPFAHRARPVTGESGSSCLHHPLQSPSCRICCHEQVSGACPLQSQRDIHLALPMDSSPSPPRPRRPEPPRRLSIGFDAQPQVQHLRPGSETHLYAAFCTWSAYHITHAA
jgi:hypothetical protein